MKTCNVCKEQKPLEDFHRDSTSRDGHVRACKRCACGRATDWYKTNPDRAAETRSEYYVNNAVALKERSREWRLANPDRKRENDSAYGQTEAYRDYQRSYRTANREQLRQQQTQRYAEDAEYRLRRQLNAAKRRARLQAAPMLPFTNAQLAQKFAYWDNRCWVCGDANTICIDHVKPLAAGGAHMLCNLRPICQPCNNSKTDKWPLPSRARILDLCS